MVHRTFYLCPFVFPPKPVRTSIASVKPSCPFVIRGFSYSADHQRNLLKRFLPPLPRQSQPLNQSESRDESASHDERQKVMPSVSTTTSPIRTSSVSGLTSSALPSSISSLSTSPLSGSLPNIAFPSTSSTSSSSSSSSSILPPSTTPPTPLHTSLPADPIEIQARIPTLLPVNETTTEGEEINIEGDGPFEILGLKVPKRPIKPGDEECCMSGCAVCIHDIYASSHEEYTSALEAVRVALLRATVPRTAWPVRVIELDEETSQSGGKPDPFAGLDPGLRAFKEFEAKLKRGPAGLNGSIETGGFK